MRHECFCRCYLQHRGNGTQAAIAAGYKRSNASDTACKLLKRPEIQARLAELRAESAVLDQLQIEHVLLETYNLLSSNLAHFAEWNEEGEVERWTPTHALTTSQQRQIRRLKSRKTTRTVTRTRKLGRGPDAPTETETQTTIEHHMELELHDKKGLLALLREMLADRKADINEVFRKMFVGFSPGNPGRLVGPVRSLLHELTRPGAFWAEGLTQEQRARVLALMEPVARELATLNTHQALPGETDTKNGSSKVVSSSHPQ